MRTFVISGVTFELCNAETIREFQLVADIADARNAVERLASIPYNSKEYKDLYHNTYKFLDSKLAELEDGDLWDIVYSVWCKLDSIENARYYEENIDAFKAYESRMNEPSFDWGFYSDWHKELYGYRPRR